MWASQDEGGDRLQLNPASEPERTVAQRDEVQQGLLLQYQVHPVGQKGHPTINSLQINADNQPTQSALTQ